MRLLFSFVLPVGVAAFAEMLSRIAGVYVERKNRAARTKFLSRSVTLFDIAAMDEDQNGDVSREEFVCFMLVALQKVTKDDISELHQVFARLDADNNGTINKHDLSAMTQQRKAQDEDIVSLQQQEQERRRQRTPSETYGTMEELSSTNFADPEAEIEYPSYRRDYRELTNTGDVVIREEEEAANETANVAQDDTPDEEANEEAQDEEANETPEGDANKAPEGDHGNNNDDKNDDGNDGDRPNTGDDDGDGGADELPTPSATIDSSIV